MDDDELVLLSVSDVRVAVPAGNGVEAGLVVLEEDFEPHRVLRMFVGQPEARAIHVSWSNTVPPRPSTWDLFVSTISLLGGRIERVVVNNVEEERHYFAHMIVERDAGEEPLILTARPSDAIALALRSHGARIYARTHVLDRAGLLADGTRWVRDTGPSGGDGQDGDVGTSLGDGDTGSSVQEGDAAGSGVSGPVVAAGEVDRFRFGARSREAAAARDIADAAARLASGDGAREAAIAARESTAAAESAAAASDRSAAAAAARSFRRSDPQP